MNDAVEAHRNLSLVLKGETMKRALVSLALTILVAAVVPARTEADPGSQAVRDTSYTTQTGERVLRIETVVPVPVARVWEAWTTPAGLKQWIAPVVAIDLRVGGTISTNYDRNARIGDSGTIRLPIINYVEKQLITLKVELNDKFPKKIRDEDQNLQEIVQIVDIGGERTKIVSSMVGWGTGADWDKTYNFFARGNQWTYEQLAKYLSP